MVELGRMCSARYCALLKEPGGEELLQLGVRGRGSCNTVGNCQKLSFADRPDQPNRKAPKMLRGGFSFTAMDTTAPKGSGLHQQRCGWLESAVAMNAAPATLLLLGDKVSGSVGPARRVRRYMSLSEGSCGPKTEIEAPPDKNDHNT